MSNERERTFRCLGEGCGADVVTEMPEGTLINKPTFSAVILVHQQATVCPNCGTAYGFVLGGLNLRPQDVAWAPVVIQKKDEPDIIIPPTSLTDLLRKRGN
jgi:hypothetical protein